MQSRFAALPDFLESRLAFLETVLDDRTTLLYAVILIILLLMAAFGPYIAGYQYDSTLFTESGEVKSVLPPSADHPLGTTLNGYDVLSRLLIGARPTILTGLLGGLLVMTIGMTIGVTAGYAGGTIDNVLMRFTDVIYGIPLLPTAIVMMALFGGNYYTLVAIIGLFLWRSTARVIRSQVLQIREEPYIEAAEALGASDVRIIRRHILPNVLPMGVLYFSLGTGFTILLYTNLSFLGLTDPFYPSWGVMIRKAYEAGYMSIAWWWSVPPGLLIGLTVLSTFMFGRRYEALLKGETDSDSVAW